VNAIYVALAIVLPAAAGTLLWQCVLGRPRDSAGWIASLGAGYVLGMLLFGWTLRWFPATSTQALFRNFAPWLAVVVIGLGVLRSRARLMPASARESNAAGAWNWMCWLLLAVLVLEAAIIFSQASALPTLTWDAWNAWLAKSKAWYFAGSFIPAVELGAWFAAPAGATFNVTASAYPEALPRLGVWMASAAGGWDESAVHLLWPSLWLALGASLYGYARLAGSNSLPSLLTAAAVIMLPLVTAHASLAGYADLWLATVVLLAGIHLLRWFDGRNWRDAVLSGVFLLLMPAVKLEGAVWFACAAVAIALCLLPRRWRWPAVGIAVGVFAIGLAFGGLPLPLPGLGVIRLAWGEVQVPVIGAMTLSWRSVGEEVIQTLFLLPNWNLLWYVAPLIVLARWRMLSDRAGLAVVGWMLGFGFAFLFFLFFFTDASRWAENFTSVNRVLMHIVPLTVFWLSLVWALPARRDTTPASAD
jgi:hypothetical protein